MEPAAPPDRTGERRCVGRTPERRLESLPIIPITGSPNESQTEDDLIWPVLAHLGWTESLRQQNLSAHVAAAAGVCSRTVRTWIARYQVEGPHGPTPIVPPVVHMQQSDEDAARQSVDAWLSLIDAGNHSFPGANMAKHLIGYVGPLLVLVLSIPMILVRVPPNNAYGFKTPKTLSSQEIWYPANRAAGWFMLAASVITICFNLALWLIFPEWPVNRTVLWMMGGTMIPLSISLLASFIYLGRL